MSILSVRAIVLSSLVDGLSVSEIVEKIRELRPDSQAGVTEVKWYISKMKKEEFLDKSGLVTPKGTLWVSKIEFKSSKTQKTAESGVLLKTAMTKSTKSAKPIHPRLIEFKKAICEMKAKDLTVYLKSLCKDLNIPYYKKIDKKDELKANKLDRIHAVLLG